MVVTNTPARDPVLLSQFFPFGVEFQKSLLRLLTEDCGFAGAAMAHIQPGYFENEVLSWAYAFMVRYKKTYDAIPSIRVMIEETRSLDVSVREIYRVTLEQVLGASLSEEQWLRDKTIDFIRRNIFVRAFRDSRDLYNKGDVDKAYDSMMTAMGCVFNTEWESPDREFFFEAFPQRYSQRLSEDPMMDSIATGIDGIDKILGGGLSAGEMGVWIAYPKRGKSTLLVNHGVRAVRRGNTKVLHMVYEGSRKMVAARYDTVFAQELYSVVKTSGMSDLTYQSMQYDYRMHSKKLIIRGFTESWDYTVESVHEEIKELKRLYNWIPELLIVDYGDLLKGRGGHYRTETENQRAAFRDLKSLANRGYALWTASQAQRPKDDIDMKAEVLQSRKIADCYDKVRVADFIGSINQTQDERRVRQMRLYAELYRDNEAGGEKGTITVEADFSKMTITSVTDPAKSVLPGPVNTSINYVAGHKRKPVQTLAPI